jgi:hypothetical protein
VFRVTRRVYELQDDGRLVLVFAPGMTLSHAEAEAAGLLDEDAIEEEPAWRDPFSSLAAGDALWIGGASGPKHTVRGPHQDAPTRSLGDMNLRELRELCADEGIYPDGAQTRPEYITAICQARGQRRAARIDAEEKP